MSNIIPFRKKYTPQEQTEDQFALATEIKRIEAQNHFLAFWQNPSREGLDRYLALLNSDDVYYWYGLLIKVKQHTIYHVENILDIPKHILYHKKLMVQPEKTILSQYYKEEEMKKIAYVQRDFSEQLFIAMGKCNTPSQREDVYERFVGATS